MLDENEDNLILKGKPVAGYEVHKLKSYVQDIPSFASSKDIRDFKKMLEEDMPVMFDGVPIEGEKRQRVMDY